MPLKYVAKAWGCEEWLVNNERYCAKLLHLSKDAQCSDHMHEHKLETFICQSGRALLNVDGHEYLLVIGSTVTVKPESRHWFRGITDCVILEVSTPDDDDNIRFTESTANYREATSV
jgi:quercetin dioxygenase-like cupin family protein